MRNSSNSACTLLRMLWEIFVAWIWISLSQSMVTRQIWIVHNPSWCSLEGLLKWLYQQIILPRPKHWPTCDITVKQPSIAAAPSGFPGFDDRNNSSKDGLSRQYIVKTTTMMTNAFYLWCVRQERAKRFACVWPTALSPQQLIYFRTKGLCVRLTEKQWTSMAKMREISSLELSARLRSCISM